MRRFANLSNFKRGSLRCHVSLWRSLGKYLATFFVGWFNRWSDAPNWPRPTWKFQVPYSTLRWFSAIFFCQIIKVQNNARFAMFKQIQYHPALRHLWVTKSVVLRKRQMLFHMSGTWLGMRAEKKILWQSFCGISKFTLHHNRCKVCTTVNGSRSCGRGCCFPRLRGAGVWHDHGGNQFPSARPILGFLQIANTSILEVKDMVRTPKKYVSDIQCFKSWGAMYNFYIFISMHLRIWNVAPRM